MRLLENFFTNWIPIRCLMVALIVLSGCQEEPIVSGSKGTIIGFITLLDERGVELQDKSNVKVTLDENHTVLSNAIGRFEFSDIDPGTYHLLFEKEGFGSTKRYNYIFTAGNVPGFISNVTLIGLASVSILSKEVEISSTSITVTGTITETDSYNFMYYFYDKPDAEPSESISTGYGHTSCCIPVTTFSHYMPIPSTSPLYVVGYALTEFSNSGIYGYYDYERKLYIKTTLKQLFEPIRIR